MWLQYEKKGCKELLKNLSDEDLDSLVETSARGKIKEETRNGKIEAILAFNESVDSVMRRRRITRDFLINYGYKNGIIVSGTSTKQEVQDSIYLYWRNKWPPKPSQKSPASTSSSSSSSSSSTPSTPSQPSPAQRVSVQPPPQPQMGASPVSHNISLTVNNYFINTSPAINTTATKDEEMALSFVKWFYEMLNSVCPGSGMHNKDFGPRHFWDNAELHVSMSCDGTEDIQTAVGSQQVVDSFTSLVKNQSLLFNPNISKEGVLIRSDPHGLKLILVCGSVHRDNQCLGMFQESFGLVQDPRFQNSWKIKVSFLRMKAQTLKELPNLETTGEANAIENLTIRALESSLK